MKARNKKANARKVRRNRKANARKVRRNRKVNAREVWNKKAKARKMRNKKAKAVKTRKANIDKVAIAQHIIVAIAQHIILAVLSFVVGYNVAWYAPNVSTMPLDAAKILSAVVGVSFVGCTTSIMIIWRQANELNKITRSTSSK